MAGALVDRAAAARVDEDLDYKIAQRKGSVEGWRFSFLAAHWSGVHAQSAKAEVEKLLLAGQDPATAAAEVSNGSSTDAKTGSEVVSSAPPGPGTEVAALTPDQICKRDGERMERLRPYHKRRGCALRRRVGLREVAPAALGSPGEFRLRGSRAGRRAPPPSVKLGSALGPKWRATVPPVTKGKDLRPQEEEMSPPIDLSIVQEVEKQQAEAGNEGDETKNGSEAKEADATKLDKETKVMDRSAKSPVIDGRETGSDERPYGHHPVSALPNSRLRSILGDIPGKEATEGKGPLQVGVLPIDRGGARLSVRLVSRPADWVGQKPISGALPDGTRPAYSRIVARPRSRRPRVRQNPPSPSRR